MRSGPFAVYMLCFPDGTAYVGRTAATPHVRLGRHLADAARHPRSTRPVRVALRQYGAARTTLVVLWRGDNWYQSKGREIGEIQRARARLGDRLLNRTRGGFYDPYDAGRLDRLKRPSAPSRRRGGGGRGCA